jgi:SAM-dependent methyltransferase
VSLPALLLVAAAVSSLALLSRQLRRPRGWFGRRVMAPLLDQGNRSLLDAVLAAAAAGPGSRVADVGFGGGYTLERLVPLVRPARVTGVELSEAMIEAARGRLGDACDLRLADAAALPFPAGAFDVVLSVNTIYFWPDPGRVLAEMRRVLAPGGRLVLGYRGRLFLRLSPISWFGFRVYGDEEIARRLEAAGFSVEARRSRWDEKVVVAVKA